MICKNCGKPIQEGSAFCANCGSDLRGNKPSSHSNNIEEQIPLLLLAKHIVKHKVAVIISAFVITIGIGGYVAIKKHQEKKQIEAALIQEISHIMSIVGTYKNYDKKLVLSSDNTATLTINLGSYKERTYKGYWREKVENYPIEIDFSDSFEIYIGNKEHSYCSTLYLYDNRLWESMSAIRSYDYRASELLEKE